ncbi:hypothetical protein [Marisediminicola sp. LYQ85]|uniref:hypothetical protein n=1 Tax=Marisediminicola sp. LYQ85 TaxID=3391062 RepID=UPI003983CF87
MRRDELDELLDKSDPAGDLTAAEQRMVADLADQSAPRRRSRYARPVAAGAFAAMLLGGGAMAAAAATGVWSPWAQTDALYATTYELPSGAECEIRVGDVRGAREDVDDVNEVIRDALAGVEFDDREVAAGAAHVGVEGDTATDDHAYETGLWWAVHLRIDEALIANDLDTKWSGIGGEGNCS